MCWGKKLNKSWRVTLSNVNEINSFTHIRDIKYHIDPIGPDYDGLGP